MRFARSPIEDSKQEYHWVCPLPWSHESSMLLEQQSPAHKSQLPLAKHPLQHSLEHDLYAQQELTTMAGDVCQANLMYTAISSTDGHAQVPVQFTADIYYDAALKAEVTAMADRGAHSATRSSRHTLCNWCAMRAPLLRQCWSRLAPA